MPNEGKMRHAILFKCILKNVGHSAVWNRVKADFWGRTMQGDVYARARILPLSILNALNEHNKMQQGITFFQYRYHYTKVKI
jgi:hypothetical protein